MKHKKGQLLGLPFIYIFALIVGAMILVWGVKVVIDLVGTAENVDLGKFIKKTESDIQIMYNDEEGSVSSSRKVSIGSLTHICFVDYDLHKKKGAWDAKVDGKSVNLQGLDKNLAIAVDAISRGTSAKKTNVFFLPMAQADISKYTMKDVKPSSGIGNPGCLTSGKNFNLYAAGTHVEVVLVAAA